MSTAPSFTLKWAGYGASVIFLGMVLYQQSRIAGLEADLAASRQTTTSSPRPSSPRPTAAPAAARPDLHDTRTRTLLDELQALQQAAVPGQISEAFQNKAWDVLFDNDASRRSRNFGLLLDVLRPEDGVALHHLFNKMHQEGRDFPDEYARFAGRWGEVDGAGALQFYFVEAKTPPAPADVHNALKGWGQTNPQAALAWALANREMVNAKPHPGFGPQEDPVNGVLRGWARTDLAAATAAMKAQYPDPDQRGLAIHTMYVESLFGKGLQPTLEWIKQLPDASTDPNLAGRDAMQDLFRRIRDAGTAPEAAVSHLAGIADQPWFGLEDLMGLSHTFRRNAAEFANALASPATQPILQAKFDTWSSENPDAMGTWLNSNKGTALYDSGAAALARSLRPTDPEAAAIWANTIQDPALKARAAAQ